MQNANIRIGLMGMKNTSLSCYMRRTRHAWSDKITQALNPRQTNSNISGDKPKGTMWDERPLVGQKGWWSAKIHRLKQFQTVLQSSKDCLWAPHNLDPSLYYQLMNQHWSRTRWLWENEGWNIYSNLMKRPSSVSTTALNQIPQQPTLDELNHLPSLLKS